MDTTAAPLPSTERSLRAARQVRAALGVAIVTATLPLALVPPEPRFLAVAFAGFLLPEHGQLVDGTRWRSIFGQILALAATGLLAVDLEDPSDGWRLLQLAGLGATGTLLREWVRVRRWERSGVAGR